MATLGLLDQLSSGLASVISGLLRVTGRTMPVDAQLNKTQPVTSLSTITQEHNAFLVTLDIKNLPSTPK